MSEELHKPAPRHLDFAEDPVPVYLLETKMLLCLPKCFLQTHNEKLNTCSSLIKSRGNLAKLCCHPDGLLGLGNGISLEFGIVLVQLWKEKCIWTVSASLEIIIPSLTKQPNVI